MISAAPFWRRSSCRLLAGVLTCLLQYMGLERPKYALKMRTKTCRFSAVSRCLCAFFDTFNAFLRFQEKTRCNCPILMQTGSLFCVRDACGEHQSELTIRSISIGSMQVFDV